MSSYRLALSSLHTDGTRLKLMKGFSLQYVSRSHAKSPKHGAMIGTAKKIGGSQAPSYT